MQGGAWCYDEERVAWHSSAGMFSVTLHDQVDSTNQQVKQALRAGAGEGLAVCALRQEKGYGRQGRTWASPLGGLYCSVLLRPQVAPQELPTLSLVASLALRRMLASLLQPAWQECVRIKWPNDVVVTQHDLLRLSRAQDAPSQQQMQGCLAVGALSQEAEPQGLAAYCKLSGISLEALAGGVCVGMGVNVFPPAQDAPVGGKNTPAYVADFGTCLVPDARALAQDGRVAAQGLTDAQQALIRLVAQRLLGEFQTVYRLWQPQGLLPFLHEYGQHALLQGCKVCIEDIASHEQARGTVQGIDQQGCLLLRMSDGGAVSVSSGEAHIVG